jgi:hypothetical protein
MVFRPEKGMLMNTNARKRMWVSITPMVSGTRKMNHYPARSLRIDGFSKVHMSISHPSKITSKRKMPRFA